MLKDKRICFFCASSNNIPKIYFESAIEIAKLIAKAKTDLIFGGGTIGLMGAVANIFKDEGRSITSVIPKKLNKKGIIYEESTKIIETNTMHERKSTMDELSDGYIALPGGFGTLDEILEVITLKQLSYHNKPITIFNVNGFFDPLINQFKLLFDENFSDIKHKNLYFSSDKPSDILDYLRCNINTIKF